MSFERLFEKYKDLSVAVVGDYCLDEYLWLDAQLNEVSLESGDIAYQSVKQTFTPGAAGTIAKNMSLLGAGTVYAVGYIGNDGRGLELSRGLDKLGINKDCLITSDSRITSTYLKPWLMEENGVRELNRIDIKNWSPTPMHLENEILEKLNRIIGKIDALVVMDQITEKNCGVITDRVRSELAKIAAENSKLIVYTDSRNCVGDFNNMILKGNQHEITRAVFGEEDMNRVAEACAFLQKKSGQPVVCTVGEKGLRIYDGINTIEVPGVPLEGPIDVTGAGDNITAGFVLSLAAGADLQTAGIVGNCCAAICVSQLGSSGHVTPEDVLKLISKL